MDVSCRGEQLQGGGEGACLGQLGVPAQLQVLPHLGKVLAVEVTHLPQGGCKVALPGVDITGWTTILATP